MAAGPVIVQGTVASRGRQRVAEGSGPVRRLGGNRRHVAWSLSLVGFLVYVFVILTYRLPIGDVGVVTALAGLLLLEKRTFPPLLIGLASLLAWTIMSGLWSLEPEATLDSTLEFAKLLLIVLVAVNVLRTKATIRLYILFFLFWFATHPVRGAITNFLLGYQTFGRALWNNAFSNPNDLAAVSLLTISMAGALLATERSRWIRGLLWSMIALTSVLIILTQSRGGFVGTAVFGVLVLIRSGRSLRGVIVAAALVAVAAAVVPEDSFDRIASLRKAVSVEALSEVDSEGSAHQRYGIWIVARHIIADHPVVGTGFGTYKSVHAAYSPSVDPTGNTAGMRDTHSTYINVTAELGAVGLALFVIALAIPVLGARRALRRSANHGAGDANAIAMLASGLLGFLVCGLFGTYTQMSFLYLHLALLHCATAIFVSHHGPSVQSTVERPFVRHRHRRGMA
jgi:probable O-glycosylation ligase (exosortase A-associated)